MQQGFDEPVECASTPGLAPHASSQPQRICMSRPTRRRLMMIENFAITPSPNAERSALVVVAGRPGSGKGTQCTRIATDLRVAHLSLGDALREEIDRCTPLGHEVRAFLEAGQLVPDRCVFELIGARLERHCSPVVLLDGFPRSVRQAEALERLQPGAVVLAVLLAVPLATVLERLRSRDARTIGSMCCENVSHPSIATPPRCWPGTKSAVHSSQSTLTNRRVT